MEEKKSIEWDKKFQHPKWKSLCAAEYVVVQGYTDDMEAAVKLLNDLREEIYADIQDN